MPVFVCSLCICLWQTIKIGANFLWSFLLHRNKRRLISGYVFRQSSWKLVQNEKDYSFTLKSQNFCKEVVKRGHLFDVIFPNSSKQLQSNISQLNLEPWVFFEGKCLIFHHFLNISKFNNLRDVIKSKLGQKGSTFVYYIPTEIRRPYSITIFFLRSVIHSWDQFFKIVILWPILNSSFWRYSKIGSTKAQICISSTIGEKRPYLISNERIKMRKTFMRLISIFQKTCPQLWRH